MKNLYIITLFLLSSFHFQAQIVNIPDANFKNALVNHDPPIDTNEDGEIQVSEALAALTISVKSGNILDLEGIQSFINLETLFCPFNEITTIDVSSNTNLKTLAFNSNNVSSIDVTSNPNLEGLSIFNNNNISSLDVTGNPALRYIEVGNNNITTLDFSANPNLEGIFVANTPLQSLNIQNGNNSSIDQLHAFYTPTICIQVDDVNYANSKICDFGDSYGWCIDANDYYSEDCSLGIENYANNNFNLYPNPSQNYLFIESQFQIDNVKIYNLQGQLIKESTSNTVDVSQFAIGLYFVQVVIDGKSETKKFIKE